MENDLLAAIIYRLVDTVLTKTHAEETSARFRSLHELPLPTFSVESVNFSFLLILITRQPVPEFFDKAIA
jgi:hypothetical protein